MQFGVPSLHDSQLEEYAWLCVSYPPRYSLYNLAHAKMRRLKNTSGSKHENVPNNLPPPPAPCPISVDGGVPGRIERACSIRVAALAIHSP